MARPESEWIRTTIPAIVDEATWDAVRRKRQALDSHDKRPAGMRPETPRLRCCWPG